MPTSRLRRRSSIEIDQLLSRQVASGLSVAAFCRQVGLNPASFYAWRRRRRQQPEPEAAFVELAVQQSEVVAQGPSPALLVRTRHESPRDHFVSASEAVVYGAGCAVVVQQQ